MTVATDLIAPHRAGQPSFIKYIAVSIKVALVNTHFVQNQWNSVLQVAAWWRGAPFGRIESPTGESMAQQQAARL